MRPKRTMVAVAMVLSVAAAVVGCSSSGGSGSGASASSDTGVTLQYWATNQGKDIATDTKILQPELDKFQKQSGIKVDLQVLPWLTINTKLLAATVSGKGPDVANFGNTNAPVYGASGALLGMTSADLTAIGGTSRFTSAALATVGAAPLTSVPLYAQAWALFYNKKMFTDAGLQPPTTWQDLMADAKKISNPSTGTYGLSINVGSPSVNCQLSFIFARQNGGSPFNSDNKPTFTTDGMVAGAQQLIDLMNDGLIDPAAAQYTTDPQVLAPFVQNKAAMAFGQNGLINTLASLGMTPDQYGIIAIPAPSPLPDGGKDVSSTVAGTNIAIFKNTKHKDAALKFVKFMTSADEQEILDKEYQVLPVLKNASLSFMSDQTVAKTYSDILANTAEPFPITTQNNAYLQSTGAALKNLFGQAASGQKITSAMVKSAMQSAQDQLPPQ